MMSNTSNNSSLVCPTIAWTPHQARQCMEISPPLSFRPNVMTPSRNGVSMSNSYSSTSSPGGSSGQSSSPPANLSQYSQRHQTLPAPAATISSSSNCANTMGWMSSPLKHGPISTTSSPPSSPPNVLVPQQQQHGSQPLQRSQTMPLVMLPISMGTPQPMYESRPAMVQTIPHRPSPPPSGPCYYSNMAPPNLPAYSHSMMLGHEAPVSQRERTKPLRDWILKHRSHPYPSKEDKLALAMMTRMRLDQVSMWFANTRRQIRKVGMKAWSGGIYATPLPHRVGNGAIIPVPEEERVDGMEDESSLTCSSDDGSPGRIPTDSSCSM